MSSSVKGTDILNSYENKEGSAMGFLMDNFKKWSGKFVGIKNIS